MKKILIVEDVPYWRAWIAHALVQTQTRLTFAQNGKLALEKIAQHKGYNALIMNVKMPIMDGYGATRKIREMGYTAPIMGYSSLHHLEAVRMAFKAGMSHYLLRTKNSADLQGALYHLGLIKRKNMLNVWNENYFFTKDEIQTSIKVSL